MSLYEDYVSFDTAKLLKEKGFNETCRAFWRVWDNRTTLCDCSPSHLFEYCHNSMLEQYNDDEELNITAPTLAMAMKWLREVHKLHIAFVLNQDVQNEEAVIENRYYFNVFRLDRFANEGSDCKFYNSHEEACEAAIKYCLKNLI